MRLKTFFFPIMLIISVAVFYGFVWPEVVKLRLANQDVLAKEAELLSINDKKTAANKIKQQISDAGSEAVVKGYLPEKKTEERIISDVNRLAGSANISLVNLSVSEATENQGSAGRKSLGLVGVLNPMAMGDDTADQRGDGGVTTNEINNIATKITVSGNYEKIRMFIDGLHRLPILNEVKSLSISKQQQVQNNDGTQVIDDNVLLADITIHFGYMPVGNVDAQKVAKFETDASDHAKETVDILNRYNSQKGQSLETSSDSKGKTNPFIAREL